MTLTNTAIQNAKPAEKPYKIYDVDGLFIQVGLPPSIVDTS